MHSNNEIQIYTSHNGEIELQVKFEEETVWLTQKQMSEVFNVTTPTISEHLKKIFSSEELEENSVIRNFLITASD